MSQGCNARPKVKYWASDTFDHAVKVRLNTGNWWPQALPSAKLCQLHPSVQELTGVLLVACTSIKLVGCLHERPNWHEQELVSEYYRQWLCASLVEALGAPIPCCLSSPVSQSVHEVKETSWCFSTLLTASAFPCGTLQDPDSTGCVVAAQTRVVLVEGLYTLRPAGGCTPERDLFDATIFIDTSE